MKNLITALFLVLFSCSNQKTNSKIQVSTYNSITFKVEENFVPNITKNQYLETDSGEYLAIFNKVKPELFFFNLDSAKPTQKVEFVSEGPNGIGITNGFHVATKDCILIASIPPKIQVLDFNGNRKRSIPITDLENKVNWLGSNNMLPFIFDEEVLFGSQPFFSNIYQTTNSDAQNSKPFYKVDLKNQTTLARWLEIKRPSDEWKKGKISPNLAWTDRGDSIIVSPISDHRLWVISKKKEKIIGYKSAKTNSINSFRIIKDYPIGDNEIIKGLETGNYEVLIYDKYRDVFYRFFFPPIKVENYNITAWELKANKPKVGLLVLTGELEPIGEFIFPDHYIENWNYFVGRKGLYVSTNNPNRDDFDENFLRYDIIRFEGLNYED